jgi:hypothetical protein
VVSAGRPATPVDACLGELRRVSPDVVNAAAALDDRVDRKYVVGAELLTAALRAPEFEARLAVLAVGDDIEFGYRSLYFDTSDDACFRQAAAGRRRRFKVRRRCAEGRADDVLEVKLRLDRGRTSKHRVVTTAAADLSDAEVAFIAATTAPLLGDVAASTLRPAVATAYRRATLLVGDGADSAVPSRLTIDTAVQWRVGDGAWQPLLGDELVVVETKSEGPPTPIDRWLWRAAVRPQRISKFGVASVLADPSRSSNRWHRVLSEYCS